MKQSSVFDAIQQKRYMLLESLLADLYRTLVPPNPVLLLVPLVPTPRFLSSSQSLTFTRGAPPMPQPRCLAPPPPPPQNPPPPIPGYAAYSTGSIRLGLVEPNNAFAAHPSAAPVKNPGRQPVFGAPSSGSGFGAGVYGGGGPEGGNGGRPEPPPPPPPYPPPGPSPPGVLGPPTGRPAPGKRKRKRRHSLARKDAAR